MTLACGTERITDIGTNDPKSKLIHVFPGAFCGVPTIVSHHLNQSVPLIHGVVVLDIASPAKPVEVSRLVLDDKFSPHWTGWDTKTQRLVVTGYDANRLYMLKLDQMSVALTVDAAFKDADRKPGFNFDDRDWPHGWKGSANPAAQPGH